jgi:multiple sugar transport system permease protein
MFKTQHLNRLILVILIVVLLLFCLFPFYWIIITSFKTMAEISGKATYFPKIFSFEGYAKVFSNNKMLLYYINTLVVSLSTVVLVLVLTAPAAYAINRSKSKFIFIFALVFLMFSMFPQSSFVIPLFVMMQGMHLLDTQLSLILVYISFSIPMAIWLLTVFFKTIPKTLEEAAHIDGCSRLGTFFRIVLPLAKPGLATTSILMLIGTWNEFFFAFIFTRSKATTLTVGIQQLQGQYNTDWNLISSASVVAIIPVIILTFVFQKQIVTGITAGGVKD